jgi:hypothetical protein
MVGGHGTNVFLLPRTVCSCSSSRMKSSLPAQCHRTQRSIARLWGAGPLPGSSCQVCLLCDVSPLACELAHAVESPRLWDTWGTAHPYLFLWLPLAGARMTNDEWLTGLQGVIVSRLTKHPTSNQGGVLASPCGWLAIKACWISLSFSNACAEFDSNSYWSVKGWEGAIFVPRDNGWRGNITRCMCNL